jgi:hypothetical protein
MATDVYPIVLFVALGLFLGFLQFASSRVSSRNTAKNAPSASTRIDNGQIARTFLGRIVEAEGKFVLLDSVSNDIYSLDDQEKAKPFDGRTVNVIGTLDAATKTIHIL